MLVRRKLAEKIIAVTEQLSKTEHLHYVLERVEEEIAKLYAHIPPQSSIPRGDARIFSPRRGTVKPGGSRYERPSPLRP